jgi:thiol-disulfide isomerase/thioredoxin
VRRAAAGLLACLLLAGCSSAAPGRQGSSGSAADPDGAAAVDSSRVDVDTPALRALKRRAGVEPCVPARADRRAAGELAQVTLPCLGGGRAVDLGRLRGPLVLNVFASWCGPCRAELPYYQRLHEKAHGRLAVLGVDYQDVEPDAALELAGAAGVSYPLVADPGSRLEAPLRIRGIRGLPVIVLVDRAGRATPVFRAFRSYAELRTLVQQRLGVAVPA